MQLVLLTALGVGGATAIGALLGFLIKKPSHKTNDLILSFAAGVMLAAAVVGLILPSLEYGKWSILVTIAGIFCGALCLNLIDKLTPHLHRIAGADQEGHPETHHDNERGATYALLAGFCLMLVMDVLLG